MRIISCSLVLSLACTGGKNVIEKQTTYPSVLIGSHSPDAEILGYIESFRATVSDDDNEFLS